MNPYINKDTEDIAVALFNSPEYRKLIRHRRKFVGLYDAGSARALVKFVYHKIEFENKPDLDVVDFLHLANQFNYIANIKEN